MKFENPATLNPIDQVRVIGLPHDRVEGPLKVAGLVPYAYERHDVAPNAAYGWMLGSAIPKGTITSIDTREAEALPGVLTVVTYLNAGSLGQANRNTAILLGGPNIQHHDQAVALVVAETLEQARDAARRVKVRYQEAKGVFDLAASLEDAEMPRTVLGHPPDTAVGDFDTAFAAAPIKISQTYTTPDQSHAMMEPHATTASWSNGKLTIWTSNQMIAWAVADLAATLKMKPEDIRVVSPYIGGGFGAKLFLRADALLAALGARAIGRPVKVALARPQIPNNTLHRPATIQRLRIGADADGLIDAIAHETWSGNLPGGFTESAAMQTRLLYRGDNRMTAHRNVPMDLPEGNAMRAPGEAVGLLALEVAMDELAEAANVDPVELRIRNDIQYDPEVGEKRPSSSRKLVECLRLGADRFGWAARNPKPGQMRDGPWLIGMGVAAAFRNNLTVKSGARVSVDRNAHVDVYTDMTDIGTGSYTILAQTAAEMMGVPLDAVSVHLGDSSFPVSSGSGGQFGANCSTAGVYAACFKLRGQLAQNAGINSSDVEFRDGAISAGGRVMRLGEAAAMGNNVAEDFIEFGDLSRKYAQATFGAHFVEVGVDANTFEVRVRRMVSAMAAGRILNPKTARSQVIGAMTMGVGAALMEELVVDTNKGYFVNHDLAEYHVPVHADIPEQDVIFVDELDDKSSPMKAKGVAELGICGVGAAVANAIYNACGVRVREFPITVDKLLMRV